MLFALNICNQSRPQPPVVINSDYFRPTDSFHFGTYFSNRPNYKHGHKISHIFRVSFFFVRSVVVQPTLILDVTFHHIVCPFFFLTALCCHLLSIRTTKSGVIFVTVCLGLYVTGQYNNGKKSNRKQVLF